MAITYTLKDNAGGKLALVGKDVRATSALSMGVLNYVITGSDPSGWTKDFPGTITIKAPPADTDRWMFFATRNRMMSGFTMPAASGLEYRASQLVFGNAAYPNRQFRFHFSGFALTEGGNSPQETVLPGNDTVIDAVFFKYGGVLYPMLFSGAAGATIASNANGVWAEITLPFDLPANALFTVVTIAHVPAAGNWIGGYRIQKHRGEKLWAGASYAEVKALVDADAANTPALDVFYNTVGNVTNSQTLAYGPDFMLAKGDWDGRPVVLVTANSHGESRNEIAMSADPRGNQGYIRRWLDTVGGVGRLSHMIMGVPGAAAVRELTTSALKRWEILDEIIAFNNNKRPFTVALNELGYNDNNSTVSTWWSRINGFVDRLRTRYPGLAVAGMTLFGRATSSNNYADTAGQTPNTTFVASNLGVINDNIRNNVGGNLAGYIDVFAAWSDATDPYKWFGYLTTPPLGQLTAQAGTDGTATWNTWTQNFEPLIGFEYRFGTITGRTVISYTANGDGTYTCVGSSSFATVVPAGTAVYYTVTSDSIHASPGRVVQIVERIAQSNKEKLVVA